MRGLFNLLASVKMAMVVLLLITAACILGTVIPQGTEVARYLDVHPEGLNRMELFDFLGLTHVFSALWFTFLLCLFACCLAACTFRRFSGALKRPKGLLWRDVGSLVTHVSMLLILAGGLIGSIWGMDGYLALREGQTSQIIQAGNDIVQLPFSISLEDFEIEYYQNDEKKPEIMGESILVLNKTDGSVVAELLADNLDVQSISGLKLKVLHRVADMVVDMQTREVTSRSDEMNNPAVQIETVEGGRTNTQWLLALYPDMNMRSREEEDISSYSFRYEVYVPQMRQMIKDWKATLVISEGGKEVKRKIVEVNHPLAYKGYSFFQSSFREDDPTWTYLQVVKDPGLPLVYIGFIMIIVGLVMVFYIKPGVRIKKG